MILVDLQQVMISTLMAEGYTSEKVVNENLLRYMIFNTLRAYKRKFSAKYGELVICCDNRHSWRKDFYPHYKAHRKKDRDDSGFDWDAIFKVFNEAKENLRTYFPYKVIEVENAEADDVIGILVPWMHWHNETPILIISSDKDFVQLQKYSDVDQYSPILKGFIKEDNPAEFLREHILRGDRKDGIPNILSADDTFVSDKRQVTLSKEKAALIAFDGSNTDAVINHGLHRNQKLIDLDQTPREIQEAIVAEYQKPLNKVTKSKILTFFITNKMINLVELIDEF